MSRCPDARTAESLGKHSGSDNECDVYFAESKVEDSGLKLAVGEAASISHPPSRICVTCKGQLTKRWQKRCCSKSCAAKQTPLRSQAGAANGNYRGGISSRWTHQAKFIANNPEKFRAHRIVQSAVRRGLLVRPTVCESCYLNCRPDAHHPDYTRPLTVEWLCKKCHRAADLLAVAERRRSA